jgi:proteasome accessory factor B
MPDIPSLERCVMILMELAYRHGTTIEDLHKRFDGKVSRRTLQRDMIRLSDAGVPLIESQGIGHATVWSIEPRFLKFIPAGLGMDEFFSLKLLQCAADLFTGTPIGTDIESAILKIKQLVPSGVLESTGSIEEEGEVLGVHRYGYIDYNGKGDLLRSFLWAAVNREACRVVYQRPGQPEVNEFDIYPYTLLYHKGAFYGIVYQPKHEGFIYVLIHRIQTLEPKGELFDRDPDFHLQNYLKGAFGILREKPEDVAIQFYPPVAASIRERIWHASQSLEEQADGSVILKMKVAANSELVAWIMYWGAYAKVVGPEGLKESVKCELKNNFTNYA